MSTAEAGHPAWCPTDPTEAESCPGYVVIIEGDEAGGFSVWSPDLLGCVAAAATYEECVALMREAIAGHLEVMRGSGWPLGPLAQRSGLAELGRLAARPR